MTRDEINKRKIARRVVKTIEAEDKLDTIYLSKEDFLANSMSGFNYDYDWIGYKIDMEQIGLGIIDRYTKDLNEKELEMYDNYYTHYFQELAEEDERKQWREEKGL